MAVKWKALIIPVLFGVLGPFSAMAFNILAQGLNSFQMFALAGAFLSPCVVLPFVSSVFLQFAIYLFIFTYSAVLFLGLEIDDHVSGYWHVYLTYGEPYLRSSWGAIASYWDGTFNLVCYLIMCYPPIFDFCYQTVRLFCSANIINSKVVVMIAGLLSQTGVEWCLLLNIFYLIIAVMSAKECIMNTRQWKVKPREKTRLDHLLVVLLVLAAIAVVLRGVAASGSNMDFLFWYRHHAEPVLNDNIPAPFAAIQGMVTMFYSAPALTFLAGGIFKNPAQGWLRELALLTAGATLHAEVMHLGMSYHHLTIPDFHAPTTDYPLAFATFWIVNILITIVPVVTAIFLCRVVQYEKEKTPPNGGTSFQLKYGTFSG